MIDPSRATHVANEVYFFWCVWGLLYLFILSIVVAHVQGSLQRIQDSRFERYWLSYLVDMLFGVGIVIIDERDLFSCGREGEFVSIISKLTHQHEMLSDELLTIRFPLSRIELLRHTECALIYVVEFLCVSIRAMPGVFSHFVALKGGEVSSVFTCSLQWS